MAITIWGNILEIKPYFLSPNQFLIFKKYGTATSPPGLICGVTFDSFICLPCTNTCQAMWFPPLQVVFTYSFF